MQTSLDRFFPISAQQTYQALMKVTHSQFTTKSTDDFGLTITFSSGMSAFSWGENYSARVLPADGGSVVKVSGVGKLGGSIPQHSRSFKLITRLLDDVTTTLRPEV
jgi:hypothetical protein